MPILHIWPCIVDLLQQLNYPFDRRIFPVALEDGVLQVAIPTPDKDLEKILSLLPGILRLSNLSTIQVQCLSQTIFEILAIAWSKSSKQDAPPELSAKQKELLDWLSSMQPNVRPVLFIRTNPAFDSLDSLTSALSCLGYDLRSGTLGVVSAERMEESPPTSQTHPGSVLIIVGLSEIADPQATVRTIEERIDCGLPTIILDHTPPSWMQSEKARMRVIASCTKEMSWDTQSFADVEPAESDSDQEMIRVVAQHVAKYFDVSAESLFDRRSDNNTLKARQAAVYVAREWGGFDFSTIGKTLGDRTYVSATQAYRRIAVRRRTDKKLDDILTAIISDLKTMAHIQADL